MARFARHTIQVTHIYLKSVEHYINTSYVKLWSGTNNNAIVCNMKRLNKYETCHR